MVVRHARVPYSDFVLLFHMAIFFIASGYLLNLKYADDFSSLLTFVRKKMKGLWLPYVEFNTLFILLNNAFIKWNIYTDNPAFLNNSFLEKEYAALAETYGIGRIIKELIKVVLFQGGSQLGGALWFFNTLFFLLIGYMNVQFLLTHLISSDKAIFIIQSVLAGLFLAAGYYCHLNGISAHGLNRVLSYYCLIHLGVTIKKYSLMKKFRLKPAIKLIISLTVLLICYYDKVRIGLVDNNYTNPVCLLITSISGWIFLYSVASVLEKHLGDNSKLNRAIQYISVHSVPIIGLHFLAFKIVNCTVVYIDKMPSYMIAAFPVLTTNGMWWLLYMLTGILIPLLFNWLWKKAKGSLFLMPNEN